MIPPRPISSGDQARSHSSKFEEIESSVGKLLQGADLKDSPSEVTPDRALVFEVIGPISNIPKFIQAAADAGFEWLGEEHDLSDVDDQDAEEDEGEDAADGEAKSDRSMLYVTMPTITGLRTIVSLWKRFARGESKPVGPDGEWWALFGYLSDVRPWSAKDRVDPTIDRYVERMIRDHPHRPIRIELDLWFRSEPDLRANAREYVESLVEILEGQLLDFATIEPIHYQAALVEIPVAQARMLQSLDGPIASADRVMKVRPQSLYRADGEIEGEGPVTNVAAGTITTDRPAVAALLDGYPVDNHVLLSGRVDVQEVDIPAVEVPVVRRKHGTSMASLIVHGDLGHGSGPIDRPLKVVPVLAAPQNLGVECTPPDKLPINVVYRAVKALIEGIDGNAAQGEHVVVINHSICDREAPFAHRPSYWAKLLDYLSFRYRLLFVVSAGNSNEPFRLHAYTDTSEFVAADPIERQVAILRSVERAKGRRIILSPAESMNSLTVGAVHSDGSGAVPAGMVEPYDQVSGVTNVTSCVGLGINRAVKPDLVEVGGRQLVRTEMNGGVLSAWAHEHLDVGQLTAAPDPTGAGDTRLSRSTGTSNAAALTTRAAVVLASVAEDLFEDNDEHWVETPTRAVVLKALLAHGCAWGDTGELLYNLYSGTWQKRREAVSRTLGYGRPDHGRIVSADGSRITLLADDVIRHNVLHEYRLPVPRAMINNREIRRVTMTLAWSSPIDPVTNRYRGVQVEVVDKDGKRKFWEGFDGLKSGTGSNKVNGPVVDATRRGTLQHIVLEGKKLIRVAPTGDIFIGVQARADLTNFAEVDVPYALAITLEIGQPLRQDLFADVAARVRTKRVAVPTRVRTRVRS